MDKKKIAILVSGDATLYSFLDIVSRNLKKEEYEVIPGISTFQLAFSRIGECWQDAKIISLHGRGIFGLAEEVKRNKRVFLFTDANFPPQKIAAHLIKNGITNRRAFVFEQLGYPQERITDTTLEELAGMSGFKMCVMIVESQASCEGPGNSQAPKLYGIGIGPGDPKLITLRAKEILDSADTIFVPKGSDDAVSCAGKIVGSLVSGKKRFSELIFPMTKDKKVLTAYWSKAGQRIVRDIEKGRQVAFVTIGDPLIYSTYSYLLKMLRQDYPDLNIETVPGISSFSAAAAACAFPLIQGNERLAILPVKKDLDGLKQALKEFDTVVLMKVGAKLGKVIGLLKRMGLLKSSILISRLGHPNERIVRDLRALEDKKAGYLSVIIVKTKQDNE